MGRVGECAEPFATKVLRRDLLTVGWDDGSVWLLLLPLDINRAACIRFHSSSAIPFLLTLDQCWVKSDMLVAYLKI